jgi:hypothetical protein
MVRTGFNEPYRDVIATSPKPATHSICRLTPPVLVGLAPASGGGKNGLSKATAQFIVAVKPIQTQMPGRPKNDINRPKMATVFHF